MASGAAAIVAVLGAGVLIYKFRVATRGSTASSAQGVLSLQVSAPASLPTFTKEVAAKSVSNPLFSHNKVAGPLSATTGAVAAVASSASVVIMVTPPPPSNEEECYPGTPPPEKEDWGDGLSECSGGGWSGNVSCDEDCDEGGEEEEDDDAQSFASLSVAGSDLPTTPLPPCITVNPSFLPASVKTKPNGHAGKRVKPDGSTPSTSRAMGKGASKEAPIPTPTPALLPKSRGSSFRLASPLSNPPRFKSRDHGGGVKSPSINTFKSPLSGGGGQDL